MLVSSNIKLIMLQNLGTNKGRNSTVKPFFEFEFENSCPKSSQTIKMALIIFSLSSLFKLMTVFVYIFLNKWKRKLNNIVLSFRSQPASKKGCRIDSFELKFKNTPKLLKRQHIYDKESISLLENRISGQDIVTAK